MIKVKENLHKCPICNYPKYRKSKYCIFHTVTEEKNEKEFIDALKEYINVIKKKDLNYSFKGFIFIGDIDFKKDLTIAIFKNADFREATFKGNVGFSKATFSGYSYFGETTFEGYAGFEEATFEGDVNFREVTFKRKVSFREASFIKYANFGETTFEGYAGFEEATFEGDVYFGEVIFKDDVNLKFRSLKNNISFIKAFLAPGKNLSLKTMNNKTNISFERASLEHTNLDLDLGRNDYINFTNSLLGNTEIARDRIKKHIIQEKEKYFSEAKKIYLLLKNNFHAIGQYEDESWAFKKEKDMERKSNCHFKTLHKWLWSCFLNAIYGYGEKPERVFLSAILIILIFTCVFMNYGITSPPLDNLPKYNILKELSMGILYGDLLKKFISIPWEQLKNCIYFSTVTFTTLGLGDFTPVESWGRIFVGLEAFIGAFMMALFVYTFARRTGGR